MFCDIWWCCFYAVFLFVLYQCVLSIRYVFTELLYEVSLYVSLPGTPDHFISANFLILNFEHISTIRPVVFIRLGTTGRRQRSPLTPSP